MARSYQLANLFGDEYIMGKFGNDITWDEAFGGMSDDQWWDVTKEIDMVTKKEKPIVRSKARRSGGQKFMARRRFLEIGGGEGGSGEGAVGRKGGGESGGGGGGGVELLHSIRSLRRKIVGPLVSDPSLIQTEEIADGAITADKLAPGLEVLPLLVDGAIVGSKMARDLSLNDVASVRFRFSSADPSTYTFGIANNVGNDRGLRINRYTSDGSFDSFGYLFDSAHNPPRLNDLGNLTSGTVIVGSLSDLPDPVSNRITLVSETTYLIVDRIDLGSNGIVLSNGCHLIGLNSRVSVLEGGNVVLGAVLSFSVSGGSATVRDLGLEPAGALKGVSFTPNSGNTLFVEKCRFVESTASTSSTNSGLHYYDCEGVENTNYGTFLRLNTTTDADVTLVSTPVALPFEAQTNIKVGKISIVSNAFSPVDSFSTGSYFFNVYGSVDISRDISTDSVFIQAIGSVTGATVLAEFKLLDDVTGSGQTRFSLSFYTRFDSASDTVSFQLISTTLGGGSISIGFSSDTFVGVYRLSR